MKKVILILMLVAVLLAAGCEEERDGVICIPFAGDWAAVADICINCERYRLSDFCTSCGSKMPLVTGRTQCVKCGDISFFGEYCGACGNETKHVLIER